MILFLQSNAGRFPVSFKCSLCFLSLNKDTFFGFHCCCREQWNEIVSLLSLLLLLEKVCVIDNKTCSSQVVEHQVDFGRTRSFVDQRTPALEANAHKLPFIYVSRFGSSPCLKFHKTACHYLLWDRSYIKKRETFPKFSRVVSPLWHFWKLVITTISIAVFFNRSPKGEHSGKTRLCEKSPHKATL